MKKLLYVGALSALLLAACNDDVKKEESNTPTIENTNEDTTVHPTTPPTELDILNTSVTLKDAIAVFQSSHPEAQIHSVELEFNIGNLLYEVTGLDASHEYEMLIDANSKKVVTDRSEIEQEIKPSLDFTKIIDPADAIQTASTNGQVSELSPTSWKLEVENGTPNYSIKYEKNSLEIEVYVHALTGELLGIELDD